VESLKNPPNTIHFPKDRPEKFLCGVCNDKQEKNGDCRYVLEQHSLTKTHQRNLKSYKKEKLGHIVLSSDDEEEEQEKKKVGRPRRSRSDDDDKKKKKTKEDDEEEKDEDESDSDRPSRKRERAKEIDLAYRPTAAARVANSVATLPMSRKVKESSVTPPAAPPARVPLAKSLFQEKFGSALEKAMMSEAATDACLAEVHAQLKTDGVQNKLRTFVMREIKEQTRAAMKDMLREIFEAEKKKFVQSPEFFEMLREAWAEYLAGPESQCCFGETANTLLTE
jgi:hypothetical protein